MATPKKKPEDLLKVGRPSEYRPEFCELVLELGKQGKSFTQMAVATGYAKASLGRWREEHPEFRDALTRALEMSQDWWESRGQEGITSRDFNAALWHKNVASRFREDYADRKEVTGAGGGPIQQAVTLRTLDVSELDDDQLEALETALLSTMGGDGKD
jgi:hypothetical protein